MPGLAQDDVHVAVSDDNVLTISGERRLEVEEEPAAGKEGKEAKEGTKAEAAGPVHHRVERSFGRFVRSFRLPRHADADKIKARVAKGVLTVAVPKKPLPPGGQEPRGRIPVEWKEEL